MTRQIRVRGRVQGVGFRFALRDEAHRLGVAGWVRNRADGSVEALLQGEDDAVKRLIDWALRGPPGSRVEHLESAAPQAPAASLADFEIRASL
jgi:acylphosphatase